MKQVKSHIKKILKKLANGYDYFEEIEEYVKSVDDNEMILSKKKITKRYVPPDMLAIKMLLEIDGESFRLSDMTDQELLDLKNSLIKKIQGEQNDK